MTETCEEKAWGRGLKGAKSFDFAIYKSHLHTQESQVGPILCSVFLSCVELRTGDGSSMGQHGAHVNKKPVRGSRLSMVGCMPLFF